MKHKTLVLAAGVAGLAGLLAVGCEPAVGPKPASLSVDVEASPWRFGGVGGRVLVTEHYRIHTTSDRRQLLDTLPGFMENAHRNYVKLTGLQPAPGARRLPVYMLGTRRQWAAMTTKLTGPRSRLYLAVENGGYCYRGVCVFWDMGNVATYAIAAHEGMHQFLSRRCREHLPAWADEGLAVSSEGLQLGDGSVRFTPDRNTLRMTTLRQMLTGGRWTPLEKLLASDAGDRVGAHDGTGPEYYGQLWALMATIRSEPRWQAGFQRLIHDAAAGKLREALNVPPIMGAGRAYNRAVSVPLFTHYVEADLSEFEKRFRARAETLAKLR